MGLVELRIDQLPYVVHSSVVEHLHRSKDGAFYLKSMQLTDALIQYTIYDKIVY